MTQPAVTDVERLRDHAASMRRLVIEMCSERGGYAGQGIALSDLMASVYLSELRRAPDGGYHDRLVLSNGHDAIAVYAGLCEAGFYDRFELLTYGADGSRIEQSPIEGLLGFEMTAGSLGEGPSQAAGIALGERLRGNDVRVYCLLSDGELQEGIVWEALMFASHKGLDNLVLLVDNNDLQADGAAHDVLGVEPVTDKFRAFGWACRRIDGNDIAQILHAFDVVRQTRGRPAAIICDTRVFAGVPSLQERFPKAHFLRANAEVWAQALRELDSAQGGGPRSAANP